MNEVWTYLNQAAIVVAALAAGGGMVYLVNWIKGALNVSGNAARALTLVTAVLVAVAIGIVEGVISQDFQTEQDSTIRFFVIGASQHWYSVLERRAEQQKFWR